MISSQFFCLNRMRVFPMFSHGNASEARMDLEQGPAPKPRPGSMKWVEVVVSCSDGLTEALC